ncbi:MAG: hypothetical protein WBQ18_16435 [Solirubrobacteraceae bacterium]
MPDSRLFMSSLSRRQLAARRRPARAAVRAQLLAGLLLLAVCAVAFLLARGTI